MDSEASTETMEMDINRIMELIPHRYPFLLIDKIIDAVPGQSGIGIKNVTINEPFFQGHFPGHPIMPGVLIVEAMAQTAGALVMAGLDNADNALVYFMTVENARFRKPVVPGDCVHIHVEMVQNRGDVWKFKGRAIVDGVLKAEAVYSAMIARQK
ncbi:MAG: 3-hydroxyacyl-[acyl-carrier-protein] dehydratase FabZ [Rhodospirillaceae bacterium]|jgi:3-hydroxyacyl-[acyl-carrier-protein] dehydratase|nr:3-hydroxyacyl-[acyl-carrier-protein] dehydratase FabZ [Rhodospirillaceae bacterium]